MKKQLIEIAGYTIPIYSCNTVIAGSGAAGYNATDTLYDLGQTDVAMVTNGVNRGTSRNTGSDKQTYYKLSLSGNHPDSPYCMAQDLFNGGCVDGDIALCEAALSTRCFYKLCSLGVDFPKNQYGEYVGYQTDHDSSCRATSAGPLTSRMMTEQLQKQVSQKGIPVFDHHQIIGILTNKQEVQGLLCFTPNAPHKYALFHCKNIIYATGGPAGLFADSVYPESQIGATGVALEAGVEGRNLTEWQFGLASVSPRWNVSGTFMQALPRFYSVDETGAQQEFVTDHFHNYAQALSCIFKKGYQWPFNVGKIQGSSIIDLLVYRETVVKKRKVYLDYTRNPLDISLDCSNLDKECLDYLTNAGATFGTPIQRLRHMNEPAYQLYLEKGVDLEKEPLEIAVSAQHNNGGLEIDHWWQSNVKGLFPCGEVAGSHGVFRPGGSALNAGQVGSTRAAEYISVKRQGSPGDMKLFLENCRRQILEKLQLADHTQNTVANTKDLIAALQKDMSRVAGIVRDTNQMEEVLTSVQNKRKNFHDDVSAHDAQNTAELYYYYDLLICAQAYLTAMIHFAKEGLSRSSSLYPCETGDCSLTIPFVCQYRLENKELTRLVQKTVYDPQTNNFTCTFREVRPLPNDPNVFETVWRSYRENKNIW